MSKEKLSTKITAAGLALLQAFFPIASACAGMQNIAALPDLGSNNAEVTRSVNPDSVAQGLSDAGSALNGNSHLGDAFSQLSLNMAESAVNSYLAQYGNASLSFDTKGTGEGKMLFPLFDSRENLLFTQLGASRNKRFTSNSGLGYRWFSGSWMLGFNTFYDYDSTGHNKRYSLGAEAATDYFSLSYNQYLPLSDWHQAYDRQYQDFDERPARGYDLTARGYLPAYPALGGKLSYERYFGDSVILAGSNDMKKNPYTLSFGLDYSPVPLFNISALHKAGSVTDNQLALSLNYRFGVPLADQLNSGILPLTRTLQGSRYNFVERNNLIALQYRKQELIRVHLPGSVSGEGGETVTLDAQVKSKYGVQNIEWSAPEFIAHGGTIERKNQHGVYLHLPAYNTGEKSEYTLTALATDVHGNTNQASTLIRVEKPSLEFAAMDVVKDFAVAGREKNEVRIRLSDKERNSTTDRKVMFSSVQGVIIEPESVQTDFNGTAVVQVSSKTAGPVPVRATLENGNTVQRSVTFVADSKQLHVMLTAKQENGIVANGVEEHSVNVVALDINGNAVQNVPLELKADNGAVLKNNKIKTDNRGMAEFRVTNTHAGKTTVKVKSENTEGQIELLFTGDPATATVRNFYADPQYNMADADGHSENRMIAEVRDDNNNPVANAVVDFFAKDKNIILKNKTSMTDDDGFAYVSLSSSLPGVFMITASNKKTSRETETKFEQDLSQIHFDYVKIDKKHAIANDVDHINIKLRVVAPDGLPATNVLVLPEATSKTIYFSKNTLYTSTNGEASVDVYDENDENDVKVSFHLPKGQVTTTEGLSFERDDELAKMIFISEKQNSVANGKDKNNIKLKIVNKKTGAALKNHEIQVDNENLTFSSDKILTDNDGYATICVASYRAGDFTIYVSGGKNNTYLGSVKTTFNYDRSNVSFQDIVSETAEVVADGKTKHKIRFFLKDANGNSASDIIISGSSTDEGVQVQKQAITDKNGLAELFVTSTKSGKKTIKLITDDKYGITATYSLDFLADTQTFRLSDAELSSVNDIVNQNVFFRGKVSDLNHNPAKGLSFSVLLQSKTDGSTVMFSGVTDNNGCIDVPLLTQKAGTYSVQVTYEGKSETISQSLTFKPDVATAKIKSMIIEKNNSVARSSDHNIIKVIVDDKYGNLIEGFLPTAQINNASVGAIELISPTDNNGESVIYVKSNKTGIASVSVDVNGLQRKCEVFFIIDEKSLQFKNVLRSKNVAIANGQDSICIKYTVADKYGNVSVKPQPITASFNGKTYSQETVEGRGDFCLTSIKSMKSGEVILSLSNYQDVSHKTTVDFVADLNTLKLEFHMDKQHIPLPDYHDEGTFIGTATDVMGNPIENIQIEPSQNPGEVETSPKLAKTNSNGNARFKFRGTGEFDHIFITYYSPQGEKRSSHVDIEFKK